MNDGPVDPLSITSIAAALRADSRDISTFLRVLERTLPDALPAGMVEVERDRRLSDRLAGREGQVVRLTVTFPELVLELRTEDHRPVAESRKVVRGVVIGRQRVGIDDWVQLLATQLAELAAHDAAARSALATLLGQSGN